MAYLYESEIEEMAIEELQALGYTYVSGNDLTPDTAPFERKSFADVILRERCISALKRINPHLPDGAIEAALKALYQVVGTFQVTDNERFHRYLTDGIPVEYRKNNDVVGDNAYLIDPSDSLGKNEFLAVNQFTIIEKGVNKRPDIILFINGLPLVTFELKNAADLNATVKKAYDQLKTYKATIPQLFSYNEICVISDGLEAKVGSYTAPFSRFSTWKTKDGVSDASPFEDELSVAINGLFNRSTLLDYILNFVAFEKAKIENDEKKIIRIETIKKIAAYHQYYAVNKAVASTIHAADKNGNKKAGVVWHTQGSGKSLSMVFYTGKLVKEMNNPTVIVITDRNDLDDQLFDTFADNIELLRQPPQQAESTEQLKDLLRVSSGGIIFTTIQKFSPNDGTTKFDMLSDRHNIVVIADEAHRTQYGFDAKLHDIKDKDNHVIGQKVSYGFAKYMHDALPNATYIGFTGTPVESKDANTPAVFGNYIDIYDIAQAVEDKITVKIYYESRLAKVNLTEEGRALVEQFDTELESPSESDETISDADEAKAKWTTLEKIVGNPERIKNVVNDIVRHFEARQEVFEGKAIIVAMSRRIAVDLYDAIVSLRPEWHSDDLDKGCIKVVMTSSSSDGPAIQKHHTTKSQRKALAARMKDVSDPLRIVIVRDMWLTGFDAPCLHTMYVDKPMKGHNLMQAIARVNRVFLDKPGGLIVDYIGIGTSLKQALNFYAESGGKGMPAENQLRATEIMIEKLEVIRQMLHGFDYSCFFDASVKEKLSIILQAENHVLGLPDGKGRFVKEVSLLEQAYALSKPSDIAMKNAEEIAFFHAIKARLCKFDGERHEGKDQYDSVIRNIVSTAISSDKVVDIFDAAGIDKPDISILSDEFLQEVKSMQYKNVALELLKKLLNDEVKVRTKRNIAQSKTLMEMLDGAINKYQNNLLTTAEVIDELIKIAQDLKKADMRSSEMGLSSDELAFYDALSLNDSATEVLGDEQLRIIAREVADKVRKNATIDWAVKESVRARLMVIVRRILKKYGYPPDKQEQAIQLVMTQAANLADDWAQE
jgi:type I restriction enzyme R subunit